MSAEAPVTIRPYADPDAESVAALWDAVFGPARDRNEPAAVIRAKVAQGDGLFFVAADSNDRPAGTVMAGYDGHRGWIYTLAVREDMRRRGIASRLLRHAEAELTARGCLKINLQVRPAQADAVAFYKTMGYLVEERVSLGKRPT